MGHYRLYCLDGAGRVETAEWIEAEDDEAAVAVASARHEGKKCELWQGGRLVAKLDLHH